MLYSRDCHVKRKMEVIIRVDSGYLDAGGSDLHVDGVVDVSVAIAAY